MADYLMSELIQIEKQIERLKKRAEVLRDKKRTATLADIVRRMRDFDISTEDIAAAYGKPRSTTRKPRTSAAKKQTRPAVPPKYRHPETLATWTGRGRAPRWISEAEAAGISRDTFLIEKAPPKADGSADQ